MNLKSKKYFLNLAVFILIFLFVLFAISNLGFLVKASINIGYIIISCLLALFYLFKSGDFYKKTGIILFVFFLSFLFANFFIDTSFDGRCYHFTLENLFKLGYNPIYDDIKTFANEHNIYYNLLFANSYPNALEVLRGNFYLLFNNMESSKIVNLLFVFGGFFYSQYFFLNKLNKIKSFILSSSIFLCAVVVCQITTKMADFLIYYLFLFQLFSIILIDKKIDVKQNLFVLISSSVLSVAAKYVGLFNVVIVLVLWFILKRKKIILKTSLLIGILSLVLCFQPYITNIVKFKNPLYPSMGHNKLDFMTKQNPKEFKNKPYLYKFFRSMFSSASDARMNNPQTPRLFYKVPFTSHFDMPYGAEDVRINGFGHLFSGIFIISVILSIIQFKRRKGVFALCIIALTTLLNPICWWARFVPQLHLLPVLNCYYFRKNNQIFYILSLLLIFNGLWVMKENLAVNAYKTYVMNNYYNNLYQKSLQRPLEVYMSKTPFNEDDTTIIFRMNEYGIQYKLVDKLDKDFKKIKTEVTVASQYWVK
ncbi:MAG: hypothetical protein IKU37_03445 [Candidatus Gastranaerophilales bacterium]|nr:hypothetical protein [Candidatus Gastranaerophilales bacterium]